MINSGLENYFKQFKENIIGNDINISTPYGTKKMIYADWIASGRLYAPIEKTMTEKIYPMVGNTHTETSETGTMMTNAYHYAQKIIKKHVNADENDILISTGFGMTAAVNKLQRLLGLKSCGILNSSPCIQKNERPVVFITHIEHHSNQTSWYETNTDVVVLPPDDLLLVNPEILRENLEKYKNREIKIGTFSACSNVTGLHTQYHKLAKIMHEYGGLCFVDFAASAPYEDLDMHPEDPLEKIDAIMYSPHKFLGGPGTSGILILNSKLFDNAIPDNPGGGTVDWTNPWGEYKYLDNIEAREDGGTPGFLQLIRSALAIQLKEKMGTDNIAKREQELVDIAFEEISKIPHLHILADNVKERLGAFSFYIDDIHFNLVVKLLNDRFGIQVRGGCACAGTYGHFLLGVTYKQSKEITDMINKGNLSRKPGWVRLSIHPTMSNDELYFIADAIKQIQANIGEWEKDYIYDMKTNEFQHKDFMVNQTYKITEWFDI